MKFISFLTLFFSLIYAVLTAHYLSFDHQKRENELNLVAKSVRDTRLFASFISKEHRNFVYDK